MDSLTEWASSGALLLVFHVAKYQKKGAFLAAHPRRHREYNRSGHAAAEIVEVKRFTRACCAWEKLPAFCSAHSMTKKTHSSLNICQGAVLSSCSNQRRLIAHLDTTIGKNGTILDSISYDLYRGIEITF